MNRYLTPEEKASELAFWAKTRADPLPAGELGGLGYPDPDIFPLVDALNALDGVCTLQSCAGHRLAEDHFWPAQLWLRLDQPMLEAFDRAGFRLAARGDLIERVARYYREDGQEIIDIVFHGNERGTLPQSAELILGFFRGLAQGVGTAESAQEGA